MKRNHFSLFGVPTILTVLIVVLIFSFATLSLLNTLNIKHSIERGNEILVDTYTLQRDMEIEIIELEKRLNLKDYNSLDNVEFDELNQIITINKEYNNLRLNIKAIIKKEDRIRLEIIEYRLSSGINQDYSQDGDPVYGG